MGFPWTLASKRENEMTADVQEGFCEAPPPQRIRGPWLNCWPCEFGHLLLGPLESLIKWRFLSSN